MPIYLVELDLDGAESQSPTLGRALDIACRRVSPDGGVSVVEPPEGDEPRARHRLFRAASPDLIRQVATLAQVRVLGVEELAARPLPGQDG